MIRNNYVARIGLQVGAHADALQSVGASHVFVINNWFDIPVSFADANGYLSNACIILQSRSKRFTTGTSGATTLKGETTRSILRIKITPTTQGSNRHTEFV